MTIRLQVRDLQGKTCLGLLLRYNDLPVNRHSDGNADGDTRMADWQQLFLIVLHLFK
jgi:hypothetical protein